MCFVDDLTAMNADPDAIGVDLRDASEERALFVRNCSFQDDVTAFASVPGTVPSVWVFADNYDSTGTEVSPRPSDIRR